MFMLSVLWQSLYTLAIIFILSFVFLVHRHYIESKKEEIKNRYIVIVYLVLFFLLAASIAIILFIWGYDISDYLADLFTNLGVLIEASIPRIIGTLIAIFVAMALYKISKITFFRIGKKDSPHHKRKQTIAKVTLSIVKYIIAITSLLSILAIWGVNVAPALAGLGIFGLVIGLGAQKFINDLISGFFIIFENHFNVGDWVEINGFMGEVVDIGLKTTRVRNFRGENRIFNNGSIDPVSNFSTSNSLAIVDFGIAYKEDVSKTIDILREELPKMRHEHEVMLEDPRVLGVTDLASSSVNIRVVVLVVSMNQWAVERAIRQRIKEILNTHNIEIPFPQMVIHKPSN